MHELRFSFGLRFQTVTSEHTGLKRRCRSLQCVCAHGKHRRCRGCSLAPHCRARVVQSPMGTEPESISGGAVSAPCGAPRMTARSSSCRCWRMWQRSGWRRGRPGCWTCLMHCTPRAAEVTRRLVEIAFSKRVEREQLEGKKDKFEFWTTQGVLTPVQYPGQCA